MPNEDFITELVSRMDDALDVKKDKRANLHPSKLVTLTILFALKGVGNRAF